MDANESEQITKGPTPAKKIKDPKKVAVGKALAEKNRRAREALKKVMNREESEENKEVSDSWLPALSFSNVLSAVGLGMTIFELYRKSKQQQQVKSVTFKEPLVSEPLPPPSLSMERFKE